MQGVRVGEESGASTFFICHMSAQSTSSRQVSSIVQWQGFMTRYQARTEFEATPGALEPGRKGTA